MRLTYIDNKSFAGNKEVDKFLCDGHDTKNVSLEQGPDFVHILVSKW